MQRAVWFEGGLDSTLSVFTHRLACKFSKVVGATFTCLVELNGGMILVSEREAREHARSRQLTRSPKSRRKDVSIVGVRIISTSGALSRAR